MDGSPAVIGYDGVEAYSPMVYFPSLRLLISFTFGNGWEMRHWDRPVAFTHALPEELTFV